tara:strand:+ start:2091 stop:2633 length:543 start_codon:yes stop_codon:yes gene_type:complete
MKNIFIILIFLITASCSKPKTVFICGDHICVSKAEAQQYFEENLTLEVKVLGKKGPREPTLIELNLNEKNQENKQVFIEKKLDTEKDVKELTINEKKKIISIVKEKQINKKIASKKSLKENNKIPSNKGKKNIIDKRIINKEAEKLDICKIIDKCTIDEISKYLIKKGNKKDFPDITTRQ